LPRELSLMSLRSDRRTHTDTSSASAVTHGLNEKGASPRERPQTRMHDCRWRCLLRARARVAAQASSGRRPVQTRSDTGRTYCATGPYQQSTGLTPRQTSRGGSWATSTESACANGMESVRYAARDGKRSVTIEAPLSRPRQPPTSSKSRRAGENGGVREHRHRRAAGSDYFRRGEEEHDGKRTLTISTE
ncbi:hypothetical protein OH76DRAFT_1413553, partial [Lentinus brumalis]